jgi:HK97 family phage major capsid protein
MRSHQVQLDKDLQLMHEAVVEHTRLRFEHEQEKRARRFREASGEKKFNLARAIVGMATGQMAHVDREFLEQCAGFAGMANFDPQRVYIPWKLLDVSYDQRDLTVASASAAGYLVSSSVGAAHDILRRLGSRTAKAGITIIEEPQDSVTVPRVTTAPSAYAIPTEGTAITETMPVLGQVALTPKNLGCTLDISRQFMLQTSGPQFVQTIIGGKLAEFVDFQILQGSGASGEFLGLFNTTGLQTQSGTTLAQSGVTTMRKLSAEAGADDDDIAFLSTPSVRQVLEIREKATGNAGFVWQAGQVADSRAYASNECPSASMVCGPWSQVVLCKFGPPGFILEINPYEPTKFKQGIIEARMIISVDMGVIRPTAFVKSTSIT